MVSLINNHTLDPAPLFDETELMAACRRYQIDLRPGEAEDQSMHQARLLQASD